MRIFIAAGGTGGHVFPSLSVALELQRSGDHEVFFLGTRRGLETQAIAPRFPVLYLSARGWDRRFRLHTLRMLGENILGFVTMGWYFLRYRPHAFLAMGSYLSLLGAIWAKILHVPIYLHEQNVYPGLANRIVARWAKMVFLAFEETKALVNTRGHVEVTGNPLRKEVMAWRGEKEKARQFLGLEPSRKTILVVGGSRGSQVLNRTFFEALPLLPAEHLQVIHITGKDDYPWISAQIRTCRFPYLVFPFLESPGVAYAASDVAVCRAGANTVTELFFFGLPAVLVPYGEAADNHQWYNAQWLATHGFGVVLEEKALNAAVLAQAIRAILEGEPQPRKEDDVFRARLEGAATRIAEAILGHFGEEGT